MYFCLAMHKQMKSNACIEPTCGKMFSNHWITNLGFKQFIIPMKRMEVEKGCSKRFIFNATKSFQRSTFVTTPLWGKCEDETRTPKSGNLESSGTPKTSELNCRGQKTLPWCVLYIVGKVLRCKCRKWPCMSHSDIYNITYGRKKGQKSNWQFDSRPLKIRNRPDPGVHR